MTQSSEHVADVYPTRTGGEFLLMPREDFVVHGTADDGPLDGDELEGFAENGYLTFADFLTPSEVTALGVELERMATDPHVLEQDSTIVEPASGEVRSIFGVHRTSDVFRAVAHDPRLVDRARQILGTDVYIHQSGANSKPGLTGGDVYWHSDFETWHAEDGMPRMRAVSFTIALSEFHSFNSPLMIMPGSHTTYVSCGDIVPTQQEKALLDMHGSGTPSPAALAQLADRHGIEVLEGQPGSAVLFDCNSMHGSGGNISPYPSNTLYFVYNSVENEPVEPFTGRARRPGFLGARDFTPVP
ncbi:ectoine hydroxylase [Myceligenerans salitolerans]|uniref:Ectoine hydroxylase n=1 Tax=Myceligenerans salitolerans TaxID=1230528 RepID=A0ABS3ICR9_9MICO|nr:ectoine hydroxylase [Myceligenerans salitolerans]MBO0610228.1 ectoine hydroxylase [Myceligenerans salitolerans]